MQHKIFNLENCFIGIAVVIVCISLFGLLELVSNVLCISVLNCIKNIVCIVMFIIALFIVASLIGFVSVILCGPLYWKLTSMYTTKVTIPNLDKKLHQLEKEYDFFVFHNPYKSAITELYTPIKYVSMKELNNSIHITYIENDEQKECYLNVLLEDMRVVKKGENISNLGYKQPILDLL